MASIQGNLRKCLITLTLALACCSLERGLWFLTFFCWLLFHFFSQSRPLNISLTCLCTVKLSLSHLRSLNKVWYPGARQPYCVEKNLIRLRHWSGEGKMKTTSNLFIFLYFLSLKPRKFENAMRSPQKWMIALQRCSLLEWTEIEGMFVAAIRSWVKSHLWLRTLPGAGSRYYRGPNSYTCLLVMGCVEITPFVRECMLPAATTAGIAASRLQFLLSLLVGKKPPYSRLVRSRCLFQHVCWWCCCKLNDILRPHVWI